MDGEFYENIFYAAFMMFEVNSQAYFSSSGNCIYDFRNQLQKNIFSKIFIMFAFNHWMRREREKGVIKRIKVILRM